MASLQKSRVTEIQVRMDCNGCVQKVKKALHGISGIYELYIDLPQQKITVVGWADPQKIVKAIKKTRKSAIICSHTEPPDEPTDSDHAAEPTQDQASGVPISTSPPPPDQNQTTAIPSEPPVPPIEQSKEPVSSPPPLTEAAKQPPAGVESTPTGDQAADASNYQPQQPGGGEQQQQQQQSPQQKQKDVEEVHHVIHHYPPEYGYRSYNSNSYSNNNVSHGGGYGGYSGGYGNGYGGLGFRHDQPPPPQPIYATHSYNTHRPSPYVTHYEYFRSPEPTPTRQPPPPPPPYATATRYEYVRPEPTPSTPHLNSIHHSYNTHRPAPYVTQYEYVKPPSPQPRSPQQYGHYSRPVPYGEEYYSYYNGNSYNNNDGAMSSAFSEENPNACTIV